MKFSRYLLTPTQLNVNGDLLCGVCNTKKARYRAVREWIALGGNPTWNNIYSGWPRSPLNICSSPRCYNMVILGTDSRGFFR